MRARGDPPAQRCGCERPAVESERLLNAEQHADIGLAVADPDARTSRERPLARQDVANTHFQEIVDAVALGFLLAHDVEQDRGGDGNRYGQSKDAREAVLAIVLISVE